MASPNHRSIFLSLVSTEFCSYRQLLAKDLERGQVDVSTQEKWGTLGDTTLDKLDHHLQKCDAVIHVVGDGVGFVPPAAAIDTLLEKHEDFLPLLAEHTGMTREILGTCSYTHFEAYLAIYYKRRLHIYRPDPLAPREKEFTTDDAQRENQRQHFDRIRKLGRDRDVFLNQERLSSFVLADLNDILPPRPTRIDVPATRLTHTAETLVGREHELTVLDEAWNNSHIHVVVVRGKGGEGKTSLVATWMAELAFKDWRGAERVIDWSFYSQGTKDQGAATAEFFINETLQRLGDANPNLGGPEERAARLARLIADKRTLLVLDGLEPLQYPPGPMHGALKDSGMAALLRGLVAANQEGLVVVTTREKVDEIKQHYGRSAIDHDLQFLSPLAGAQVLFNAGATRAGAADIEPDDNELQQASEEVHGHALTLFLVGQYLHLVENGDIRRRDTIGLADAEQEYQNDNTRPYGHAFKAMEAYENWFAAGDEQARLELSVLRMLGLFDRPATSECLRALRDAAIPGLSDLWQDRANRDWNKALVRLAEINLLEVTPADAIDCHPLVREYFAEQLRTKSADAFRAAHSRLFDYLCEATEPRPDTLPGLQPLYQAVTHGCLAERHEEARSSVYRDRILRGTGSGGNYSTFKLGAIGADLGAVASFFDQPWSVLSPNLSEADQAWLLNEAAFSLRALGRLTEAVEPMRVTVDFFANKEIWKQAAQGASNLSELELTLGLVSAAVSDGRRSIEYADLSEDAFLKMGFRTTAADALHQQGSRAESLELFAQAEQMQAERQPQFPLLYSLPGFLYVDLLLAPAERAAWQCLHQPPGASPRFSAGSNIGDRPSQEPDASALRLMTQNAIEACDEAIRRATQTLEWGRTGYSILDIALDHLTLARASLYRAILDSEPNALASDVALEQNRAEPAASDIDSQDAIITQQPDFLNATNELQQALTGLRQAGTTHHLPKAVLTAAMLHSLQGGSGVEQAFAHLAEAEQIATRGPMPLYLAEIHLSRARIAGRLKEEGKRRNIDAKAELTQARRLIEEHNYGRRKEELEDAEASILKGTVPK